MRHTSVLVVAAVFLGAATTATPLCAQTALPDSVLRALALIRTGSIMRIETNNGRQITGSLQGPIVSSVALKRDGVESTPLSDVRAAWTGARETRDGAIMGGVFGALVGVFLPKIQSDGRDKPDVGGVLRGGVIGALVGRLFGAMTTQWTLAHESRTR